MINEYIKILNLPKNFKELSQAEQLTTLNKAWRIYVVHNHPDVNKTKDSEEKFKRANEAHEKLLELVKNGSIKYYESNKKEYKQGYSSNNTNNTNTGDPLDDAINSYFEELRERERRKEEARKRKEKELLQRVVSLLLCLFVGCVCLLGMPFTLLFLANFLVGKAKRAI